MKTPKQAVDSWAKTSRLLRLRPSVIQMAGNLVGTCICTSYFMYFDPVIPDPSTTSAIPFVIVMFAALVVIGSVLEIRWERDINRFLHISIQGGTVPQNLFHTVQKKVLNLPFVCAGVSLFNWGLASLLIPGYLLFSSTFLGIGSVTTFELLRICAGILLSGIVTAAIIFFAIEVLCRNIWPPFFPSGDMRKTAGVVRLNLGYRLFIAFSLTSILPMILMAVLSYNKARMMLVMDPETVIQSLFRMTAFLLAAELALAVTLSYLVSRGIVGPVGAMTHAMARVEKGDLSVSAHMATNDELGALGESFDRMIEGLRDRERIKETFGRFVTPEIAEAILKHPPAPGGENTEVSILFSDIRNYTTICEQLTPQEVIGFLNDYFAYMVEAIEKNQGLVYQFVGDAIMAVFGAPVRSMDHADRAVSSGLAMLEALHRFNQSRDSTLPPVGIGIGINSGSVVAGIIGSKDRMEYRVVGDAVNLAARIESLNKELGTSILISKATADLLKAPVKCRSFPPMHVKGRSEPIQVFEVFDDPE